MNGDFVATLPDRDQGRARLRIPRDHLRGFNELLVHVHYPDPDPCAGAALPPSGSEPPRVEIASDSVLHVEGLSHFANLPDVMLVIAGPDRDGYEPTVRQLTAQHNLADRTLFTGMLNGQERLQAYVDADLFAQLFEASPPHIRQIDALRAPRGRLVQIDWDAQLAPHTLA